MSKLEAARSRLKHWRENPVDFVRDNFHVEPDAWQRDVLTRLGGPKRPRRRSAMKACTGPGKTAVLAWIGWLRLSCYGEKGKHPKGAALSGEGRDNLQDNLWSELAKWQAESDFLKAAFTWTKSQIYANDFPETWFLSARSYAKDADAEAIGRSLSGLHSPYPFILLDEIGDMPIAVGQKATQIFTGGVIDGLIAGAGNPTSVAGLLYHVCTVERDLWDVTTITADPDDPKRTPRVDAQHAREQIEKHGRDNPWIMATILGEFPPAGFNTLLGVEEVEAAMRRHITEDQYRWSQKRLGVDVARFGDDRTVIFPRQGLAAFRPVVMRHKRDSAVSVDIATRVMMAKQKWGSEMELLDDTVGWAHGTRDVLVAAGHSPIAVAFNSPAFDPRYKNRRAEMWMLMADWVRRGGALPNIPELVAELTTPTYTYLGGKLVIEDKDLIKEKLGRSPDLADALALTFAMPDMPGELSADDPLARLTQRSRRADTEFDPYRDTDNDRTARTEFDPYRDSI